jgi:hypothetical protein
MTHIFKNISKYDRQDGLIFHQQDAKRHCGSRFWRCDEDCQPELFLAGTIV